MPCGLSRLVAKKDANKGNRGVPRALETTNYFNQLGISPRELSMSV